MKRVLLTGMSGTGKSTLVVELAARGYRAVDLDDPDWSEHGSDGDWVWREDRVHELLRAVDTGETLFVSGCAENQVKFYSLLNHIILLSARRDVIAERLATRTNNSYGKHPDELADVMSDIETVEPLLRRGATHEIDTSVPLDVVVATVLRLVGEP